MAIIREHVDVKIVMDSNTGEPVTITTIVDTMNPRVERQEGPFLTNSGEFRYKQDDASVRRDQEYFIYYLKSKSVKYELTSTKDEIVRDLEVMQETYKRIHTRAMRDRYPRVVYPTTKKLPFGSKYIARIFARNKLNPGAGIVEVSTTTKTNSYMFVKIQWQISGPLDQAEKFNQKQLNKVNKVFPGIAKRVPLLQLHETKIIQEKDVVQLLMHNPFYSGVNVLPPIPSLKTIIKRMKTKKLARVKRKKRRLKRKIAKIY
jgi:hypothetical protein